MTVSLLDGLLAVVDPLHTHNNKGSAVELS